MNGERLRTHGEKVAILNLHRASKKLSRCRAVAAAAIGLCLVLAVSGIYLLIENAKMSVTVASLSRQAVMAQTWPNIQDKGTRMAGQATRAKGKPKPEKDQARLEK